MRNGFNQFSLPYMNELTANQFGAASVFGGNTPLPFIRYSMDTIANWFQGQQAPQTGRPEDFEEVIINGRRVLRRKQTQLDQILQLPNVGPGGTPGTFPGQVGGQAGQGSGIKKCDENSSFFDRFLGRCCVGEIDAQGNCVLVNSSKPMSSEEAQKLIKAPIDTKGIVIVVVGALLLLVAVGALTR